MLLSRLTLCAVAFAGLAASSPAFAQSGKDSGLVSLHTLSRVGGKICMADHYHDGASSGQSSRKAAEAEAIRNWQDFTAWEYGGHWGSFGNAESKKMTCSGGGSWSCNISARPCRKR